MALAKFTQGVAVAIKLRNDIAPQRHQTRNLPKEKREGKLHFNH